MRVFFRLFLFLYLLILLHPLSPLKNTPQVSFIYSVACLFILVKGKLYLLFFFCWHSDRKYMLPFLRTDFVLYGKCKSVKKTEAISQFPSLSFKLQHTKFLKYTSGKRWLTKHHLPLFKSKFYLHIAKQA